MKVMKFFTSLILSTSLLQAAPIQIYFEENSMDAIMIKSILIADYSIPEDLIELSEAGECGRVKQKGKLSLCLKNNGDLLVVSVDRNFINESLSVFRAQ
jgi:hypothetical protein